MATPWLAVLLGGLVLTTTARGQADDKSVFDRLDISGNGYLTGTEIAPEIRAYDLNGDKVISWEEFTAGRARDRGVRQSSGASSEDEALWKKLDWNPDGWLDGKELEGGWIKFDADGNGEVTKAEFLAGRTRERGGRTAPTVKPAAPTPRPTVRSAPRPVAAKPAVRVSPRRGHIVGSISAAPGVRLGKVTVDVSGFEDGKLAATYANGALAETVNKSVPVGGASYAVPVPPGAYRASAYSTYQFNGKTYHFPLELTTEPAKYDYQGLQLEKLRGGIVRSFVLKLTGPKKGEKEGSEGYTETTYKYAYYGGRVDLYADSVGAGVTTALRNAYPPESRVLITLTPRQMVDGSPGETVRIDKPLGEDGQWTFNQRGVKPGTYAASARLRTPNGEELPLKISLTGQYSTEGLKWQDTATFTFAPASLGPIPRMGVDNVRLYLGR
jgi:hypothetical protein